MAVSYLGRADLPRGLRNNNPGNLRITNDTWQGSIGNDGSFVTFSNMSWGVRAMATIVAKDIIQGKNTITKYITEYAPPSENDTAKYISRVSAGSGFGANQVLPMSQDTLQRLIRAQIAMENGDEYSYMVPSADIIQGIQLMNPALLASFDVKPVDKAGAGVMALVALGLLAWWGWHK